MNKNKIIYALTFYIFLIFSIVAASFLIYYSVETFRRKTEYIIKYNLSSFYLSLSYSDIDGNIKNTLQSMLNAKILNSYQVYYNDILISKSPTNFDNLKKIFSRYLFKDIIDDIYFISFKNKRIQIHYKKFFYNSKFQKIGSIDITTPVLLEDFYDFIFYISIFFILTIILYIILILYILKYLRIIDKSIILQHDIMVPFLLVENSLYLILRNRKVNFKKGLKKSINNIKFSKEIIRYMINEYIFDKKKR